MTTTETLITANADKFNRVEQKRGRSFTTSQKVSIAEVMGEGYSFPDAAVQAISCIVTVHDPSVHGDSNEWVTVRNGCGYSVEKTEGEKTISGFFVSPGSNISHYIDKATEWLDDAPGIWTVVRVDHYGMTNFASLVERVANGLKVTKESASNVLDTYIRQMEIIDSRTIDRDAISKDDDAFLMESVKMHHARGELEKPGLAAIKKIARAFEEAERQWKDATEKRDQGIRDAVEAGVRAKDIMEITGLSRARVYQICAN